MFLKISVDEDLLAIDLVPTRDSGCYDTITRNIVEYDRVDEG